MHSICKAALLAGLGLALNSCGLYRTLTGYNKGFGDAGGFYAGHYDDAGIPIYGHENGKPVYGYTQKGSPVHELNQLYAGCYVPNWPPMSQSSPARPYPQGVRPSSNPPRRADDRSVNSGKSANNYASNY